MNPSPELDALVAEKVMGWKKDEFRRRWHAQDPTPSIYTQWLDSNGRERDLPAYSVDIAAAWTVVEKLKMTVSAPDAPYAAGEYANGQTWEPGWEVEVTRVGSKDWSDVVSVKAPTAPHAICLAALKAKGVAI